MNTSRMGLAWVHQTNDNLPPEETPVLTNYQGGRILERRWEIPGYYDSYQSYWYWDDPLNDGQEIAREDVKEWMYIPTWINTK
jgi:hypothetical protein